MSSIEVGIDSDLRTAMIKCMAIIGIVILDCVFMLKFNVDGIVFASSMAFIAGIAGYEIGKKNCPDANNQQN